MYLKDYSLVHWTPKWSLWAPQFDVEFDLASVVFTHCRLPFETQLPIHPHPAVTAARGAELTHPLHHRGPLHVPERDPRTGEWSLAPSPDMNCLWPWFNMYSTPGITTYLYLNRFIEHLPNVTSCQWIMMIYDIFESLYILRKCYVELTFLGPIDAASWVP